MNIIEEKAALRRRMRDLMASCEQNQSPSLLEERSATRALLHSHIYAEATVILAYAATGQELSLDGLIAQAIRDGKTVALPRCTPADCTMSFHRLSPHASYSRQVSAGAYGIREPAPSLPPIAGLTNTTLVLMPGLAFTREGRRLGRGRGFYDRFLAEWHLHDRCSGLKGPVLMGVCHSCQLVDWIPTEDTDITVDHILSPEGIISCSSLQPEASAF